MRHIGPLIDTDWLVSLRFVAKMFGVSMNVLLLMFLYFIQGLPYGLQAQFLPIYLRTKGLTLTSIGLLKALYIPWLFKFVWGPLVDRYATRRQWLLASVCGLGFVCLAGATYLPTTLPPIALILLLLNLFASIQDVAVDATAIGLLAEDELGQGNTAQVVGYKLGSIFAGGVLGSFFDASSWSPQFIILALLYAEAAIFIYVSPNLRRLETEQLKQRRASERQRLNANPDAKPLEMQRCGDKTSETGCMQVNLHSVRGAKINSVKCVVEGSVNSHTACHSHESDDEGEEEGEEEEDDECIEDNLESNEIIDAQYFAHEGRELERENITNTDCHSKLNACIKDYHETIEEIDHDSDDVTNSCCKRNHEICGEVIHRESDRSGDHPENMTSNNKSLSEKSERRKYDKIVRQDKNGFVDECENHENEMYDNVIASRVVASEQSVSRKSDTVSNNVSQSVTNVTTNSKNKKIELIDNTANDTSGCSKRTVQQTIKSLSNAKMPDSILCGSVRKQVRFTPETKTGYPCGHSHGRHDKSTTAAVVVESTDVKKNVLFRVASVPGTGWMIGFLLIYKLGENGALSMLPMVFLDHKVPTADVSFWTGLVGQGLSILGSVLSGYILSSFRHIPLPFLLQQISLLRMLPIGVQLLIVVLWSHIRLQSGSGAESPISDDTLFGVAVVSMLLLLLLSGMATTVAFTLMMQSSRIAATDLQATHYTILATAEILGKLAFGSMCGSLADLVGYQFLFLIFAATSIASLAWLRTCPETFRVTAVEEEDDKHEE